MERYARTDLACERMGEIEDLPAGCRYRERRVGESSIQTLWVDTEDAAALIGKPRGLYLTVDCGRIPSLEGERMEVVARLLAGELCGLAKRLTGKSLGSDFGVLIAGLGNASLTADAIGPETVARLTVTRHLREHESELYHGLSCCAISALAPGVLGQTGIETLEILRGTVHAVRPDLLVVIDALAARSCDRLASTVQITDTGITPGSGVGNHRIGINRESVGIPVISVGVPTVVDSATLVYDALQKAGKTQIDGALREVLENGRSFFVSPKESDLVTEHTARLLSSALGMAFGGALHEIAQEAYF
ncbi:MAG: GPR endopeptidase [Clostridia bacterium]|nr:GPR endopeptidase [Clostridia bacterium]